MTDDYKAMLGSLTRFCRSVKVATNRVVVGTDGILGALGCGAPSTLSVWTDPLAFELFAGTYNGAVQMKDGSKVLESWAPFGTLVLRTGPWKVADEDFGGMREVTTKGEFQHWGLSKAMRWFRAQGAEREVRLIERQLAK
jgi:hypothetical protein